LVQRLLTILPFCDSESFSRPKFRGVSIPLVAREIGEKVPNEPSEPLVDNPGVAIEEDEVFLISCFFLTSPLSKADRLEDKNEIERLFPIRALILKMRLTIYKRRSPLVEGQC